ncbi:klebicin D activity protein, partial [Serratia sp. CY43514]
MDINIPGMGDVHIDGVHGLNPGKDNSTNWDDGKGNGNGGRDSSSSGDSQGAAIRRQVNAIKNDPKVNNILKDLQKKVRAVTTYAKVALKSVEADGKIQVQVGEIRTTDEAAVSKAITS